MCMIMITVLYHSVTVFVCCLSFITEQDKDVLILGHFLVTRPSECRHVMMFVRNICRFDFLCITTADQASGCRGCLNVLVMANISF